MLELDSTQIYLIEFKRPQLDSNQRPHDFYISI